MIETASDYEFFGVMETELDEWWPKAEPLIMRALIKRGAIKRYQPKHIREWCDDKKMVLWIVADGDDVVSVFLTKIDEYPLCRELVIWLASGQEMESWIATIWDMFKRYARACRCKTILIADRAGWHKVLSRYDKVDRKTLTIYEVK